MDRPDFTLRFTAPGTPDAVYAAIVDVRSWWTGAIEGATDEPGAAFTYRYEELHRSTQRVDELVPGQRVAWHVTDAELGFTADPHEWNDTDIVFTLAAAAAGTEVTFTHRGLRPTLECYDQCTAAWTHYLATFALADSLRARIAS